MEFKAHLEYETCSHYKEKKIPPSGGLHNAQPCFVLQHLVFLSTILAGGCTLPISPSQDSSLFTEVQSLLT